VVLVCAQVSRLGLKEECCDAADKAQKGKKLWPKLVGGIVDAIRPVMSALCSIAMPATACAGACAGAAAEPAPLLECIRKRRSIFPRSYASGSVPPETMRRLLEVCMCMCICVDTNTLYSLSLSLSLTHTHTHMYMCIYIHTCIHACIRTFIYIGGHVGALPDQSPRGALPYIHTYFLCVIHTHIHAHIYIGGHVGALPRTSPPVALCRSRTARHGCDAAHDAGLRIFFIKNILFNFCLN